MPSSYPSGLDAFTTGTLTGIVSGSDHGNKADAINKIEAELGTDPSGTDATVKDSLAAARRYYPVPSGGDDTAGFESAVNALPAGGGEIQLRADTYQISALTSLMAQSGVTVRGVGVGRTNLQVTGTTGNAIDMTGSSFCTWEDMTIVNVNQRTAGSLFRLDDGAGSCQQNSFRRLWLSSCYRGFHMTDVSNTRIEDITIGDFNDAWAWRNAIHADGATISTSVDRIRGGTAAQMTDGFCHLAHTSIDTFHGFAWDVLNFPIASQVTTNGTSTVTGVTNTAAWRNGMYIDAVGIPFGTTIVSGAGTATMVMSAAASGSATVAAAGRDGMIGLVVDNGTWAKFTNVSIECGLQDAVTINGGTETHFISPHLLGLRGAYLHGGTGTKLIGGNVVNSSINGITIDGGTDALISDMDIHDVGNGGGGSGWNGITIAAGVSDFQIVGNTIGRAILGVTTIASGIVIAAGASNNYRIRGNRCLNYTDGSATGVSDGGTGTSKDVGGNAGLLTGGYEIGLKLPVRAASVGTLTLTAPGATIDGVTMVAGNRFLAKDQTTASQNGIYTWTGAATTATRTSDADTAAKLTDSLLVNVDEGTLNADTIWSMSTPKPITLGSTSLRFGRLMPGYNFASRDPWSHGGNAICATMDRNDVTNLITQTAITAICSFHGGMVVPAGRLITNINAFCTAAGSGAVTLFWWALVRQSDRVVLQRTANSTTLPTVDAVHTRALQAAITLDYDTPCYIAFATQVATTSPSFAGVTGLATSNFQAPILTGNSSTAPTSTPPTVGAVLGAPAAGNAGRIHCWLS